MEAGTRHHIIKYVQVEKLDLSSTDNIWEMTRTRYEKLLTPVNDQLRVENSENATQYGVFQLPSAK